MNLDMGIPRGNKMNVLSGNFLYFARLGDEEMGVYGRLG